MWKKKTFKTFKYRRKCFPKYDTKSTHHKEKKCYSLFKRHHEDNKKTSHKLGEKSLTFITKKVSHLLNQQEKTNSLLKMSNSLSRYFLKENQMYNTYTKMLKFIPNQTNTNENHNRAPFYIHQIGRMKIFDNPKHWGEVEQ